MFFSQKLFYFQKNIYCYIKKMMFKQFAYQYLFFILTICMALAAFSFFSSTTFV
jgi:hypothetical protein